MKIALAQINTTVGDFEGNFNKIVFNVNKAIKQNCDLIVFPELSITGYPPKDLLLNKDFVNENLNCLQNLKKYSQKIGIIVGFANKNKSKRAKPLYNCAALLYENKIKSIHGKTLLPTYDVFDEDRYFESADKIRTCMFKGKKLGITICEDMWAYNNTIPYYQRNPVNELIALKPDIIINISASPFHVGMLNIRQSIVSSITKKNSIPFIYLNSVGGNDSLIFDGGSFVFNKKGNLILQLKQFDEDFRIIDTKIEYSPIPRSTINKMDTILNALILGVRDFTFKTGFKKTILGLSGGIDSALVLYIAVKALGPENVLALYLPSPFSSKQSERDSKILCKNLGVNLEILPITSIYNDYLTTLKKHFKNLPFDTTEENIQARIRANIIMAFANKFRCLMLNTGNKSELSVGYCTLYGDMCGGLAVISDITKATVYELSKYINLHKEIIPENIIKRAPSAELKFNQKDQDTLPPYKIIDKVIKLYIEDNKSIKNISKQIKNTKILNKIISMINRSEFKRMQAPPGLKISSRAFGEGRKIPIAFKLTKIK